MPKRGRNRERDVPWSYEPYTKIEGSLNFRISRLEQDGPDVIERIRELSGFRDAILFAGKIVSSSPTKMEEWAIGYKIYSGLHDRVCIIMRRKVKPSTVNTPSVLAVWLFSQLKNELDKEDFVVGKVPTHRIDRDGNFEVITDVTRNWELG